jgi:hypothetical protein
MVGCSRCDWEKEHLTQIYFVKVVLYLHGS